MPELPEVETIRRGLEKYTVGKRIESIDVIHSSVLQGNPTSILKKEIVSVRRIGKILILDFSNGYHMAIHVKLTGQLIYQDEKTKQIPISKEKVGAIPNKFTRIVFRLDKNSMLYYNDQRRFGWIKILNKKKLENLSIIKTMGPEPFKDLTLKRFQEIIYRRITAIKPQIMDQTQIGGIGNIYANDALFEAKINPKRQSKALTGEEIKRLYKAIIKVMKKSLKEGGASELTFVNILGQTGNYQSHTLVYGKKGQLCPRNDGGVIERIEIGGRGTFFCPKCQH